MLWIIRNHLVLFLYLIHIFIFFHVSTTAIYEWAIRRINQTQYQWFKKRKKECSRTDKQSSVLPHSFCFLNSLACFSLHCMNQFYDHFMRRNRDTVFVASTHNGTADSIHLCLSSVTKIRINGWVSVPGSFQKTMKTFQNLLRLENKSFWPRRFYGFPCQSFNQAPGMGVVQ